MTEKEFQGTITVSEEEIEALLDESYQFDNQIDELDFSELAKSKGLDVSEAFTGVIFEEGEFSNIVFEGITFDTCTLSGGTFLDSKFLNCRFINSDFSASTLSGASFHSCEIHKTNFAGSEFTAFQAQNSIFHDTNFNYSNFNRLSVMEVNFDDLCSFNNVANWPLDVAQKINPAAFAPKCLIVEDDRISLTQQITKIQETFSNIRDGFLPPHFEYAETLDIAEQRLSSTEFDVIIVDDGIPTTRKTSHARNVGTQLAIRIGLQDFQKNRGKRVMIVSHHDDIEQSMGGHRSLIWDVVKKEDTNHFASTLDDLVHSQIKPLGITN